MKFLHTSDWHLGRSLYGRKRYEEFSAFLDWLADTIENEKIDVLLVAGDIFDTTSPSNRAQNLYYRFLCRVATSCCRHIVIIGGNHDSPTFLNAPKELLLTLNVHVVGAITDQPEDEIIVLCSSSHPEEQENEIALVCAVPYLRDKDIRRVEPGESIDDKSKNLMQGVKNHYDDVVSIALTKREELAASQLQRLPSGSPSIPLIAMGHLFTAGASTVDGDGVRELYVGSLAHVGEDTFSDSIDYLALGHLHVPQKVGKSTHIRYSGSPIPMGFGEAKQKKKMIVVEFSDGSRTIEELLIPTFQTLERISGSLTDIKSRVAQLKQEESSAWLEIEFTGFEIIGDLRGQIEDLLVGSDMEILRIQNRRTVDRVLSSIHENETLDDLDETEVFERCLDSFDVPAEERVEVIASYQEILTSFYQEDSNAE